MFIDDTVLILSFVTVREKCLNILIVKTFDVKLLVSLQSETLKYNNELIVDCDMTYLQISVLTFFWIQFTENYKLPIFSWKVFTLNKRQH